MPDFYSITLNTKILTRLFETIKVSNEHFYNGSPCWDWQKSLNSDGYGQMQIDFFRAKAHQWMYSLFVENVPKGKEVDHLCKRRNCVNPAHLEAVTHRENVLRGSSPSARDAAKTHCSNGHLLTVCTVRPSMAGVRWCEPCTRQRSRERYLRMPQEDYNKMMSLRREKRLLLRQVA